VTGFVGYSTGCVLEGLDTCGQFDVDTSSAVYARCDWEG
jgi:hypothetical protein